MDVDGRYSIVAELPAAYCGLAEWALSTEALFGLQPPDGDPRVTGNLSLKCPGLGAVQAHEAIRALPEQDWATLAIETADGLARGRVSKLQPCLPQEAEDRLLVDKLMDVEGTVAFLAGLHVPVVK